MKATLIPCGREGWERKKRLFSDIFSRRQGPPYIYNDVLILVPSSRMKRMYGRLFLDLVESAFLSPALVQPDIQTLHQFYGKLYSRVSGPELIDENSRLVLIEGIVKDALAGFSFSRGTDVLAPSLSSAVAAMIEQLSAAGVTAEKLAAAVALTDFNDKPQVRLLIGAYDKYEKDLASRGLIDPAGMLSYLVEHFDPSWLAAYSQVVIDGIHDARETELALLRKIAACEQCLLLVEAPSAPLLKKAGEFHPLRMTREFVEGLGGSVPEEPAPLNPGDLFLAEALFSNAPFELTVSAAPGPGSFDKRISALSAINMREEVSLIAGEVKDSIRAGTAPDSILVAFPSLDEYGPLVEEIFTDYGIPYNRALGRQLGTSPVAAALISLLRTCQEDFSGPSVLRAFSSPFLKFAETPGIAPAFDRFMRDRRITGGKQRWLAELAYAGNEDGGVDLISVALNDLFSALGKFSLDGSFPLDFWMERLAALLSWSGLGARVAIIKGPLNTNLQAHRKLGETLATLAAAGKRFSEYAYTFNEWFFLLRKTLMHARFQVPPEDEGGVQVLGFLESAGRAWNEVYLGGLVEGKFPQRLEQNIFLPELTLETLGVRSLEKARLNAAYHFYRLLLSAGKVTLTWPENEGDRPVVPSPFLEELAPLRTAGLMREASHVQFSLKTENSRSLPELAKAVGLAGDVKGIEKLWTADIEGAAAMKAAYEFKPAQAAPVVIPPSRSEFRVTELDDYLRCPYDYYIRHILRIGPLEEVTEDISPLDRGSKVHAILRNFYLSWNGPLTRENRNEAADLLKKLADSEFGKEADTFRNRRDKELFLTVMTGRFLDAEEEFWKQGMRPAYLELELEPYTLTLPDGRTVELHGKVDRIDVDESGSFVIVDYKTGDYPRPKMNLEQDIFQLPVYAAMAQQSLNAGARHALPVRKPIGLAYYDLKGKSGAGARDVVLYNKEARDDHPSSKPRASSKSAKEFEAILTQSMDKARGAIEGILAGEFFAEPQDENKCRYCPNEMMCDKTHDNE